MQTVERYEQAKAACIVPTDEPLPEAQPKWDHANTT